MRHASNYNRLSRQSAHRKALLCNQAKSLLQQEQITTTLAVAKESRRLVEKLITMGKKNTLGARRLAFATLKDRDMVKLLFSEVAPRFGKRAGGYTRIVRIGRRKGDNAELVILELTELKPVEEKKTKESGKAHKKPKLIKEPETTKPEQAAPEQSKSEDEGKEFLGGLKKFLKKDKPNE